MNLYTIFTKCVEICNLNLITNDVEDENIEVYRPDVDNELIACKNYRYCKRKLYKRLKQINFNLCDRCIVRFGNFKLTGEINECCVCLEEVDMIKLPCTHTICGDCWYKICFKYAKKFCPICRYSIK